MSSFRGLLVTGWAVVLACNPGTDDDDELSTSLVTLGDDGSDGGGNDGVQRFDVAQGETDGHTGGDVEGDPCKKVDLLFVIDNSGSMEDEQTNLSASFPGFIDAIQTQLAETEGYHVGVTTSDLYAYNGPTCLVEGGLVTRTGGMNSSLGNCGPYAEGRSYMTEADDLATTFSCAARVGTSGDGNERPMQTLQAAISDPLNGAGQCNEGFIRNDALLVIVIITDEEDDHEASACSLPPQTGSLGEPTAWYDAIVAQKGGIESNVVVLALVGPDGADACPSLDKCNGGIVGAEVGSRVLEFTRSFTHGFIGRVCEPTYDAFFSDAVSVIKSACDDFMPPA